MSYDTANDDETGTRRYKAPRFIADSHEQPHSITRGPDLDCDFEVYEPDGTKVILLMGMTGTGKSSFIKLLTGNKDIKIGEGLDPETSEIRSYQFFHKGRRVALVDTPGFDDNRLNMSDSKLLGDIANFLLKRHSLKTVHGFIYFHRISDNRVGGTTTRNIRMFSSLCGPDAMKNVVIVTTKWDEVSGEGRLENAKKIEAELLDAHFKGFDKSEDHVHRHYNTFDSAHKIMSSIVKFTPIRNIQVVVDILGGKTLAETEAGRELKEQLSQLIAHYESEITRLCAEFNAAFHSQGRAHKAEIDKLRQDLDEMKKERETLQSLSVVVMKPTGANTRLGSWVYGIFGVKRK